MDPTWIPVSFACGFGARLIGLPPLVGFLIAGFVLQAMGVEKDAVIEALESVGVTLLLFSIGLKLRVSSLLRPEVWGGATVHMALNAALLAAVLLPLSMTGLPLFSYLDGPQIALIAFALSFSSTVFAVKILEQKSDSGALYGRTSIGVLIMQDVFAVVFLVFSAGKMPSPWALLLFGLIPARPLFYWALAKVGHGELLILLGTLLGIFLGHDLFEFFDVKGDLGALLVGMLLAPHPKGAELAKSLLGFKDLFLVAFFLSIGMSGDLALEPLGVALLLALFVPLKVALYFLVFTRFRLKARTSLFASFSLANYSEFGLIVGAVAVTNGWMQAEWLLAIALAVSVTFIAASPLNDAASRIQQRWAPFLSGFEAEVRHPEEAEIAPPDADVVIVGMGRVGEGAYEVLSRAVSVLGIDRDPAVIERHRAAGRQVMLGDPSDVEFWERLPKDDRSAKTVVLAMDDHASNLYVTREIRRTDDTMLIAATARHEDERVELEEAGANRVRNFYGEAGNGLADEALEMRHV